MSNGFFDETRQTARSVEHDFESSERSTKILIKHYVSVKRFNRFLRLLGPGLITGAADDDPSGIATYSQAGASFGYSLLWIFPVMYPLLLAVQESCARIGAVTGKGLAAVIKDNYSRKLLYASVVLVVIANVINIGADLGAMAAAMRLLIPVSFSLIAIVFALVIIALEILVSYKAYAKTLKWLAVVLFAYPITAFLVGEPWRQIARATLLPHIHANYTTIYLLVGIIGTTISPYLFFWDTAEVAENEIIKRRASLAGLHKPKITKHFLHNLRLDNFVGMTLTCVTAFFIVITCATVLFKGGVTQINSAADAAKALQPLVHNFPHAGLIAKLLFSVGVVGIGLLAIPVLSPSTRLLRGYRTCNDAWSAHQLPRYQPD
jgi:NRAMP (natural resistance-associated macrophage protein)-like metal ion transporter